MHFLLASDSFKDALTAQQACQAMARGLLMASPMHTYELFPMADGGEGTLEALVKRHQGAWLSETVNDPLGRAVVAKYGLSADRQTAFIDLSQASGLMLLSDSERNPMHTHTYGTGQLIRKAIENGAINILIGIGGSATNDAGMGIAKALGYVFKDENGGELEAKGENLPHIRCIEPSKWWGNVSRQVKIEVLCDVDNPLFGAEGAAYTYASQKGASTREIAYLDDGLRNISAVWETATQQPRHQAAGAGAAGGVGWGLMAFLEATLTPGAKAMIEYTGLSHSIAQKPAAILTGEGQIDEQTKRGKVVYSIAQTAQDHGVPVIGFCGALRVSYPEVKALGLTAAYSLQRKPNSLQEAIQETERNLVEAVANAISTFGAASK